jgi:hypothetical protein
MAMAKQNIKKQMKENEWRTVLPKARRLDHAPWQATHGMFITGQSWVDELTLHANEMEKKWGSGRLRLLVGPELRDKFDRQRYMTNQALHHGGLEDLKLQCQRMINGWKALDKAAVDLGKEPCPPDAWDIVAESGMVYVFVRTIDDARDYRRDGRRVCVYTLDEVAKILDAQSLIGAAKEAFEGAEVVSIRRGVGDALDDLESTQSALDDEIPF